MSFLTITVTKPKRWDGCEPLTNDERRGEWAAKFYGYGHHHDGVDQDADLQDDSSEREV